MPRHSKNPRKNVFSFRCPDDAFQLIQRGIALSVLSRSNFLLRAAIDAARREEEEQAKSRR